MYGVSPKIAKKLELPLWTFPNELIRVGKELESGFYETCAQSELEMQKLEDCYWEIDLYQQQLETASLEMDKLKTEFIETK